MYRFQSIGQEIQPLPSSNPYCENLLPNMCAKDQRVIDRAKEDCKNKEARSNQVRGLFGGLGRTCTLYASDAQVGINHYNLWDPCMLAKLPLCGGGGGTTTTTEPSSVPTTVTTEDIPEEEVEEDGSDNGQVMIGGILAILVLGGVGYVVFKNRKKKKKKGNR